MALAQIDNGLKSLEAAYAERLHRWQQMAIERVSAKIRAEGANVIKVGFNLFGPTMELRNDLFKIRQRIVNFGRGQINDELKRQEQE